MKWLVGAAAAVACFSATAAHAETLNTAALEKATGLEIRQPQVALTKQRARRSFALHLRATSRASGGRAPLVEGCRRKDRTAFRCVGSYLSQSCRRYPGEDFDIWAPCPPDRQTGWETIVEAGTVLRVAPGRVVYLGR